MGNTNSSKIIISLKAEYRAYYKAKAEAEGKPFSQLLRERLEEEAGGMADRQAARAIVQLTAQADRYRQEEAEADTIEAKATARAAAEIIAEELEAIAEHARKAAEHIRAQK